jgi:hypothetical protein
LLGLQFISVHRDSLQFKSTAEVGAEVSTLLAVQEVKILRATNECWILDSTLKGWSLSKRVKYENADQDPFVTTFAVEDSDLGVLWALALSATYGESLEQL